MLDRFHHSICIYLQFYFLIERPYNHLASLIMMPEGYRQSLKLYLFRSSCVLINVTSSLYKRFYSFILYIEKINAKKQVDIYMWIYNLFFRNLNLLFLVKYISSCDVEKWYDNKREKKIKSSFAYLFWKALYTFKNSQFIFR